jgi:Ca2+-binding RTX toxin-like protein
VDGVRSYTLTGTADELDEILHGVTYNPKDGFANTTVFAISVQDAEHMPVMGQATVVTTIGNAEPGEIRFQGGVVSVLEHLGTTLTVGFLQTHDSDGDPLTYTLADDGGGRIDLVGHNQIVVKNSSRIDFEQTPEFSFKVMVSDGVNPAVERTITLGVENRIIEYFSGTGGNDILKAGSGNDKLTGLGGNDTLGGGTGRDELAGGAGEDVFLFDSTLSTTNNDFIDFKLADNDRIWLKQSTFNQIGIDQVGQALSATAFALSTDTITATTRIIYNQATGEIFYDANGAAAGLRVLFATIAGTTKPLITQDHFFIV